VLSIGKLAAGPSAGRYYIEQVAQGREDYYAGDGEAPGGWHGAGAEALGLDGEVDEGGLSRLLSAEDPATGASLRRPLAAGAVAGFDLTFRAPKSVGLLFGVAEAPVAREAVRSHEAAVRGALRYLEREACRARRGAGGREQVTGEGFVAAAFRHRSSRAGDPLLHTHVVVANATRGPDGRWTALDGRELYRHAKTAGYLYQAVLRAELTERLGVEWNDVVNGAADVRGVPREVIEHFSERRAEIVEHMRKRGERSARAAQVATLETRRGKEYGVPVDRLRAEWRARSAEHGLDQWALADVVDRGASRDPGPQEDVARRLAGPEGLTRDRSTFSRREVVQAFAEAAHDGARVEEIESAADAFLRRGEVIALGETAREPRYTTRELLQIERELLDGAERRRGTAVGRAQLHHIDEALAARPSLSDEQRELVDALAWGTDGVQVVRAPAGTGKTFALDAAREAWQRSGVAVLGCALSARAACELRDQAAIDATTIARLTHALDRGAGLARGGVLVVDEAGMVGTRDLARLAEAAAHAEAKLVLVGDDRQLPEIDAGGAFRALADRLGATELREVRRQREAWDRDALGALRDGDTERFAREYHEHGRIVVAPTADEAREALVGDWWRSFEHGEQALMIAHRRADVADLNARARERLRDAGQLGPDELPTHDRVFATGDRVVATRNDRATGILNGETGTLADVRDDHLTVELDAGRRVELPHGYAEDGRLGHGYAITAHRAQGATVDRTFVLGSEELYSEWAYTALSRHRDEARFYITASPTFLNQAPEPLRTHDDVVGAVARMLDDSRAEQLALHGLTPDDVAEALGEDLDRAHAQLHEVEERLAELQDERDALRWYQRSEREEIDDILDGHTRAQDYWRERVDDLNEQLAERPAAPDPPDLWRAADPLAASDAGLELDLAAPPPDFAPDIGLDLGP
jgi:conjugative relaxase-like TrwC/TraI family protein